MRLKRRFFNILLLTVCALSLMLLLNFGLPRTAGRAGTVEPLTDEQIQLRMNERLQRVRHVCKKYGILPEVKSSQYRITHPPAPQFSVFYFDSRNHVAYCPLYKSASTSMLHWLLRLKGVTEDQIRQSKSQISDVARSYYPSIDYPAAEKILDESSKLLIVRHPLERLLSAYRDKLENSTVGREHGTWHYFDKYGRSIVSKYRKSPKDRIEPTFDEFVNYIIDTNLNLYADDHWIPYYLFCTPCLVDYDVIAKFETLDEDLRIFVKETRLSEWGIPSVKHVTRGGKSREKLASYFKTLKRETIFKLYDKFQFDFELFDYNVDEILTYTDL